eukprot:TRINITY_DN3996_c0_g2_i3.p2 TRINITY_DN3996_c0_g2~~TRINITY_DN3996_c0_g2_i3.p2  ORF type:complete len:101 (+),score=15.26 TRINITY_DN3996_c0_g2_i3:863-1165(+)
MWLIFEGISTLPKILEKTILQQSLLVGVLSFANTYLSLRLIVSLSSLSYSIINVFKKLVVIFISVVFFGTPITWINFFGILFSCFGILLYASSKGSKESY